jgi:glyoxylate/hydroxypyruvate reductase
MPAILLAVTGTDAQPWEARLRALAPQRDIRLWPDRLGDAADIAYACAWHAPRGLFARLPKLKVIFSLGAGVDHIFADPDLPGVPVVRIVDPDLTMRMTEYVLLHVLAYHRRQRLYDVQQRERLWHEHAQPRSRGSAFASPDGVAPRKRFPASNASTARLDSSPSFAAAKFSSAFCRRRTASSI